VYRRDAGPDTDVGVMTENPHNQMLAVGIQLGLTGALALIAMWVAHLARFAAGTAGDER
jgi:O-antigen ligase